MRTTALRPLDERGWLARQPPELREWAAENGRWRHYAPRQVLYDAGDEADGLYGLGEGGLEITFPLVGDEPVTVYRAEPGFWIGESALLAGAPRAITVAAATETRLLVLSGARVRALVAERPQLWRSFYELSHHNALLALTALAEALALTPRARLARMLLRLADEDRRVVARQEELARLIGMTRSSLQRALSGLIEAGAVTGGYGRLTVRAPEALEALCDEA